MKRFGTKSPAKGWDTRRRNERKAQEAHDRLVWTVDNIYTIARRELRRAADGKSFRPEMWEHVRRLCERTGAGERTVGVLRDDCWKASGLPSETACSET